jgi:mono/diheme cytochrome c family protein
MRTAIVFLALGLFLVLAVGGRPYPAAAQSDRGKGIFEDRCAICHGSDGKGNGPAASSLSPSPTDFTNPGFWQGDVNAKITDTIENGKGPMPPVDLDSSQIKAVIDYMSQAFK